MKQLNLTSKIFLFLSLLSGSLWMGGYLLRMLLTFQLFERKDFVLKSFVNQQNLSGILTVLYAPILTTFIVYIIFIICFTLFLSTAKIKLKNNGWLFIITIIVYLTLPFEVYLMTFDYKAILLLSTFGFNNIAVINLIIERFKALNSFPIVELLAYFSTIYFILFQPFKVKEKLPV